MKFTSTDIRNAAEGWLNTLLRFAPRFVRDGAERYRSVALLAMLSTAISLLTVSSLLAIKFAGAPVYSATTFIQPYMLRKEYAKETGQTPMDDKMVVDGAIQLIESHSLSRKIAEKLKLDSQQSGAGLFAPIHRHFFPATQDDRSRALDLAARGISEQLSVANPRKSHMIEVSYTATSPEQAAQITNAVASEYIVFNRTTDIAKTYARAQRQLQDLSSRYGVQHPRVISAKQDLAVAHAEIEIAENSVQLLTPQELLSTGLVIPASAISIPSNRRLGATIWFGILLGCLISLGLLLILEPGARTVIWRFGR